MKVLRKVLKYILRGVLFLWGVIVLLVLLLYVPAVQDYVKTKVESYAAVNLGVNLSVKRVLLKFPLDLYVEKVYVEQVKGDTLLAAGQDSGQCFFAKVVEKRGRGSSVATGKGGRPFIRQLVGNEIRRCFGTIAFAVG